MTHECAAFTGGKVHIYLMEEADGREYRGAVREEPEMASGGRDAAGSWRMQKGDGAG